MRVRQTRRAEILEAAARIVASAGAGHLTIDAVAEASGISKGGVLYHFPTKKTLLECMVADLLADLEGRAAQWRETLNGTANPGLVARVLTLRDQNPAQRVMARSLLAAAAEDPGLLAPARDMLVAAFQDAGRSTRPQEFGWILLLATEGLRLLETLDLLPLSQRERQRVHDTLVGLAQEHGT